MSVVNAKASPIEEVSAFNITLGAIPDSYASTIGYTATVAVLGMIAEAWDDGVIDPSWLQLHRIFRSVKAILKAKNQVLVAQHMWIVWLQLHRSALLKLVLYC